MATETKQAPSQAPANPFLPSLLEVQWEARQRELWDTHQKELQERAEAKEKKRLKLRKALDPQVAAQFEARKPLYEWNISCTYTRPNGKGRIEEHKAEHKILAQDKDTAWAIFCDKIGAWPGPKNCEREITRLEKVSN